MEKNDGMIPSSRNASIWSSRAVWQWIAVVRRSCPASLVAVRTHWMSWSMAASPFTCAITCQLFVKPARTWARTSLSGRVA